ncbi:MAG: hypothetical protein AAF078_02835 [Planctomycetota bacterium]
MWMVWRRFSGAVLWSVISAYVVFWVFELIIWRELTSVGLAGGDTGVPDLHWAMAIALSVVLAVACAWRVSAFHPHYLSGYRQWLEQSPWSVRLPLPLGAVGPTAWDAAVVLAIAAWLWVMHGFDPRWALVFSLLGFAVPLLPVVSVRVAGLSLVGLPLLWYPHGSVTVACVLLTAWVVVLAVDMRRELAKFPFADDAWKRSPLVELRRRAIGKMKWPFDKVGPVHRRLPGESQAFDIDVPPWGLWLAVGWLAWVGHAITWSSARGVDPLAVAEVGEDEAPILLVVVGLGGVLVTGGRLLVYGAYAPGARPPMTLLARIVTGRLLIPRWDVVWLGPLATLLCSYGSAVALIGLRVPMEFAVPAWILATLLPAVTIGPDPRRWRYTGHFGYDKPTVRADDANARRRRSRSDNFTIRIGS